MICKLCQKEKTLLKQSHIVPNFIYKELRDEDNSFVKGNLKDLSSKKIFTGFFESNILCKDCDNVLLSKLENYGFTVLYGGKIRGASIVNEINQNNVEWTRGIGVDYTKFKLFLLSILWRFSISSSEFYNFVDLGKHEEIIRKMLINNDAGEQLDYPCSINSYRKHKELPFQIISQPLKHRHNNGICYSVMMGGLLYTFYMSKDLIPDYIAEIAINKNNELKVLHMPKDSAIKVIKKYFGFNPFS